MEKCETQPRRPALPLSRPGKSRPQPALDGSGFGPATEYTELRRLLEQQGLFAKEPLFYVGTVSIILAMLSAGLSVLATVQGFGLQLLNAVFLAFVFCQLSFIVHDASHCQIFRSPWKNHVLGTLFTNLVLGMSYGYWRDSHNRHHANPNQVDLDPDIDVSPVAFTEEQARGKTGMGRFIIKYQAYLFIPMLLFDPFRRRKESIQFLFRHKAKTEIFLLGAHYVLVVAFLFLVQESWKALLFLFLQQASYGLFVASVFAPNHKGMLILPKDTQMDLLRRQVVTTRNIQPHLFTDFWFGALNYQVEHHLFPNIPRNKLKGSQRIVREFCVARGILYTETSAFDSYRQTLNYLHSVGATLREEHTGATEAD